MAEEVKETPKQEETKKPVSEEAKAQELLEKTNKAEDKEKTDVARAQERPFERRRMSREEREKEELKEALESWKPKTELGKKVKTGKIKNVDDFLEDSKILEEQIIDTLLNLESDLLAIGQSKGKFGGGKRRAWKQTQRKTEEGNVPTFSSMVVVGDKNGHVGLGVGRGKETLPARDKALRKAKLNLIKVNRGCGSFDCTCSEHHSIPFIVEGKCGSSKVVLFPAPQGTGLVIGNECKKILKLAGIKDVYSKTYGQTKTTVNLGKACLEALKKTKIKIRLEGEK
jgi:small subunit ribosomal protein S5